MTTAFHRDATAPGDVLLDKTYYTAYPPSYLFLSGQSNASAGYAVDDVVEVQVTRLDDKKSTVSKSWDFSGNCSGRITPVSPAKALNIRGMLKSGRNVINIKLRDKCGGGGGSTDLYLDGAHLVQTAGDRTDTADDLYTPGTSGEQRNWKCAAIAISPAARVVEYAGPIVLDRTVTANARINTHNYFCGFFNGVQRLTVARCAKCDYEQVASNIFNWLPTNGSLRTEPLKAQLRPGANYYRLEFNFVVPQVGKTDRNNPQPSLVQQGAIGPAVLLIG